MVLLNKKFGSWYVAGEIGVVPDNKSPTPFHLTRPGGGGRKKKKKRKEMEGEERKGKENYIQDQPLGPLGCKGEIAVPGG